jgi:hypothetical protein
MEVYAGHKKRGSDENSGIWELHVMSHPRKCPRFYSVVSSETERESEMPRCSDPRATAHRPSSGFMAWSEGAYGLWSC